MARRADPVLLIVASPDRHFTLAVTFTSWRPSITSDALEGEHPAVARRQPRQIGGRDSQHPGDTTVALALGAMADRAFVLELLPADVAGLIRLPRAGRQDLSWPPRRPALRSIPLSSVLPFASVRLSLLHVWGFTWPAHHADLAVC